MKCLFIIFLVLSLQLFADTLPAQIVVGFAPAAESSVGLKASEKIATELSKQTGVPVKAILAKNQNELMNLLSDKKVDFAFLTSLIFVEIERKMGVKVLLKKVWEEPYYYSVLLVNQSSKIKKITDLKGKRLAFVDKNSGSGYLYPQVLFRKNGILEKDFKEIIFSGTHLESVALLEQGKVDAIAVFSDDVGGTRSAWQKFHKENKMAVRKIWASDPIPNDPFCVRQEFYDQFPKLTHTLMFALIDVVEGLQKDSDVKSLMGAKGFQPATSRQYDAVRDMVQTLGSIKDTKD